MKFVRPALIPLGIAAAFATFAADTCPKGYGNLTLGEPCIPRSLLNYLYCLQASGGGKIEVVQARDNAMSSSSQLSISVGGRGAILSGSADGKYRRSDAERAISELRQKLDPSLATNCKSLATVGQSEPTSTATDGQRDLTGSRESPPRPQQRMEFESIDFVVDQTMITERSAKYLRTVAKKLAKSETSAIRLSSEVRPARINESKFETITEQDLRLKRMLAVRTILVSAGYESDRISLDMDQLATTQMALRFDNDGRQIEGGVSIQVWP